MPDVRFGSKADICAATSNVRFTPDSDHESGHLPVGMSALPPKADMCGARVHVRLEPIADIDDGISHLSVFNLGRLFEPIWIAGRAS